MYHISTKYPWENRVKKRLLKKNCHKGVMFISPLRTHISVYITTNVHSLKMGLTEKFESENLLIELLKSNQAPD